VISVPESISNLEIKKRRLWKRDGAQGKRSLAGFVSFPNSSPLPLGEGKGEGGGQKRFHFYLAAQSKDLRHSPAAMQGCLGGQASERCIQCSRKVADDEVIKVTLVVMSER